MKVSHAWLKQYVATQLPIEQLAEKLRLTSSEVEGIEDYQERLAGLVVGEVISVANHPNSQKLHVAEVLIGKQQRHIVCGAPNLIEGQKVIVALPGITIHPVKSDPVTIQIATIRGEKSEGMLCAYEEIGINLSSEGIIVLDPSTVSGTSAAVALGLDDTVLDLEITPNRPDLLSYLGLAREIGAFESKRLQEPSLAILDQVNENNHHLPVVHFANVDSHLCPRISAIYVQDINVAPSPQWLQSRLFLSGIKPVNIIVDITNFVMLELGQPLHAYDAQLISNRRSFNPKLGVRSAKLGEKISALDHTVRELNEGDIVITADQDKIVGLAGIMGGEESAIAPQTTSIIIEAAAFYGPQIRRTSRRLGLRTEASTRFEKGLDPEQTVTALKRAAYLIQQIIPTAIIGPVADHYPKNRSERPRIHVNYAWVQQILGVHIGASECKSILQKLGFHLSALTKSSFDVVPPSWRADVQLPEDVVEELVRIWGYDRLPSSLLSGVITPPHPNPTFEAKRTIRHTLAAQGFHECVSLSLTSAAALQRTALRPDQAAKVLLPLSSEGEYLIPTHLIPFLQNATAANREEAELKICEIGTVFRADLTEEETVSLLIRTGTRHPDDLYREIKTVINRLFFELFGSQPHYNISTTEAASYTQSGSSLTIEGKKGIVGEIGLINPSIVQSWKIRSGRVMVFAQISLPKLLQERGAVIRFNPGSSFPAIRRDVTFVVPESLPAGVLESFIITSLNPLLVSHWSMGTLYRGKPLESGTKSITAELTYQASDRTLEDAEVNTDINRLVTEVTQALSTHPSA